MAARNALTLTLSRRAGEGIGAIEGVVAKPGVSGIPLAALAPPYTS